MRLIRAALLAVLLLGAARAEAAWHSVLQVVVASGGGGGGVAFVQGGTGAAFSGTTVSHTLTGVGAGHLILIAVCANPNTLTVSGITVGGVAATLFSASTGTANSYNCRGAYFPNATAGSNAIVATLSGTCAGCNLLTEEYSGTTAAPVSEGSTAAYVADGTAGTTLAPGSFTTTTNGDLIWAVLNQPNGVAPTVGAGYTAASAASPWWSEYATQATAGSINPNFTSNTGAFDNFLLGMGIKP